MSYDPSIGCPASVPLCVLAHGAQAAVSRLGGKEAINRRLRELGFCEAATVKRLAGKKTVMCEVCGTKLALSAELARLIHVQPVNAAKVARER